MNRSARRNISVVLSGIIATIVCCIQAQDRPRPINEDALAAVHQFGIVRAGDHIASDELLDLPEFVHQDSAITTATEWVDFSALYIIPPQMTTAPMRFNVKLATIGPKVAAWYPYARQSDSEFSFAWNDVHAGVLAEGYKTRDPVWMAARSVETAATLKVYKPGPPGSKPDDEGTTEGDVFLFARRPTAGRTPLRATLNQTSDGWEFREFSPWSDIQYPLTTGTVHAWIAQSENGTDVMSRQVEFDGAGRGDRLFVTSATVKLEPYSRETSALRTQLIETFAGNGLRFDEATAQAKLVIKALQKMRKPALIYLLPPKWVNKRFGLKIEGPAEKPVRVFVAILELDSPA